jgi:hypothetical protein
MEGDRWYDFVRRSYYDMNGVIAELKAQHRNPWYSPDVPHKAWYESGYKTWTVDPEVTRYDEDTPAPNVTASSFTLPLPSQDVVFNGNLMKDPVHVDIRETYSY